MTTMLWTLVAAAGLAASPAGAVTNPASSTSRAVAKKQAERMGRLDREWARYQGTLPWGGAACGLVAAEAMDRFRHDHPRANLIQWIRRIASRHGLWDASNGMHGPAAEQALLRDLGLKTRLLSTSDVGLTKRVLLGSMKAGRLAILSTTQHYFVIEGRHPRRGCFYVGNSGRIMQANGAPGASRCMSMAELASVGRGVNGVLLLER